MVQLHSVVAVKRPVVLAVDDNPVTLRLLESMLARGGYSVISVANGAQACEQLERYGEEIEVVLLDRIMPQMDGIQCCQWMRGDERFKRIPVIMQTSAGRPDEIREGIEAGVFYYLVKPLQIESLLPIVASALERMREYRRRRQELQQRNESIGMVYAMECCFRSVEEGEVLAPFLAQFFPEPEEVLIGISELFINAVEHGNLGISYAEKSELVQENNWRNEMVRRMADPELGDRLVRVSFRREGECCSLQISDEGNGFEWRRYMQIDPERATDNHGRGIAMANLMSFDELCYNERGNQVTAVVHGAEQR